LKADSTCGCAIPLFELKALNDYGRDELYDLVWGEAMATLAPKLGLSDVGLKKRCLKLGVPTPPRGYWAKLEAGQKVKKTPLPDTWKPVKKKPKKLPQSRAEARVFKAPRSEYPIGVKVPIVTATAVALAKAHFNNEGLREVGRGDVLKTKLADESIGRGIWLWTELFQKLKAADLTLTAVDGTFVSDGKQKVTIELKEMVTKFVASAEDIAEDEAIQRKQKKSSPYSYVPTRSQVWAATGTLLFRADNRYGSEYTLQWKDSALQPLEDRLDQMASDLKALLGQKAIQAIEAEKQRKLRAEEAVRQAKLEEIRRHEHARRKKLARLAGDHAKSVEIVGFVDAIRSRVGDEIEEAVAAWFVWAEEVALSLSPVDALAELLLAGEDPVDPDHEDLYSRSSSSDVSWTQDALESNYWKSRFRRKRGY